jgi:uroporphyrinogen-III decarboxylase
MITGRKGVVRQPLVLQRMITKPEDVDRLHIPDPRTDGKVPVVLEAVRLLEREKREVPVFLGIISPLMLAMQLRGDDETMMDMSADPNLLKELLGKTTEFILEYAREAVEAGADQLVLDDSSQQRFSDAAAVQRYQALRGSDRQQMRKMDMSPSFTFVAMSVDSDRMIEIDVDAISIDEAVPISTAKRIGLAGIWCHGEPQPDEDAAHGKGGADRGGHQALLGRWGGRGRPRMQPGDIHPIAEPGGNDRDG